MRQITIVIPYITSVDLNITLKLGLLMMTQSLKKFDTNRGNAHPTIYIDKIN